MQETGCAGTCLCGRLQQPRRYLQLGEEGDISYLVGIILCQGWEGFWKWPSHDADKLTKVGDLPKTVQLASGHTQNQSPELRFQTLMCSKIFQAACLKEREGKKNRHPRSFLSVGRELRPGICMFSILAPTPPHLILMQVNPRVTLQNH